MMKVSTHHTLDPPWSGHWGYLGATGHRSVLQVFLSPHPKQMASLSPPPLCWASFKLFGLKPTTSSEWPSLSLKIPGTIYVLAALRDVNLITCNVLCALCRAHTVNAHTAKLACPLSFLQPAASSEEDPAGSVGGRETQNPTSGWHEGQGLGQAM